MSDEEKARRTNAQDEKLLEKYRAKDARRGTPSKDVLTKRALDAAKKGCWKTVHEAVVRGADVNLRIRNAETASRFSTDDPLIFPVLEENRLDLLRELVQRGVDRSGRCYRNGTPSTKVLVHAAVSGHVQGLAVLLAAGTEGLQEDMNEALAIASIYPSRLNAVRLLLDYGANDYKGALDYAERNEGTQETQKILLAAAAAAGKPLYAPVTPAVSKMAGALASVFDVASGPERRALLTRLREKYAADFEALEKEQRAAAVPRPKNVLNM